MTEHRLLTGASLHEPKGVENATQGQVYVADGNGSGSWVDRFSGINNLNTVILSGKVDDVSTPNSSFFVVAPLKANIVKVYATLSDTISTSASTMTLYKNNVAQTPTITIPTSGSGPGATTTTEITPNIPVVEGDVLEFRSNGASETAASLFVSIRLIALS